MFLRVVRATVRKGVKRDYVRALEAYRDHDGNRAWRRVSCGASSVSIR
jgi:hypothetical protein